MIKLELPPCPVELTPQLQALKTTEFITSGKQKRVWDDIAHAFTGPGGCHDKAMREFLERGADIWRGLGRGPQLAEDHPRAQRLQKAIRPHLRLRLELGLPVFGKLLAEGQGDGGNREEHGRCADDLPGQDPGY